MRYRPASSHPREVLLPLISLAAALLWSVSSASAQVETLSNANSTITIDTSAQTGMNSWTVDNVNVLNQQWFWFRVGPSGPQASIDTLGAPMNNQLSSSYLQSTYSGNPSFSMQVVYSLVGGAAGSGASDLSEQIKIQNLTGSPLDYHFFQYADFVAGPGGDLVELSKNARGLFNEALVTSQTMTISEDVDTAVSPGANRGEAAPFQNTFVNLNTVPGLALNNNAVSGPGGTNTWAFEWDEDIPADGTMIISKDLNVAGVTAGLVPEPGTLGLASLGLAVFGFVRSRRARRAAAN